MVIWKEQITTVERSEVFMPEGSKILHSAVQDCGLYVWFLCDPSRPKVMRLFGVYGTGNPLPNNTGVHVGTVEMGVFVWHIFDHGEAK